MLNYVLFNLVLYTCLIGQSWIFLVGSIFEYYCVRHKLPPKAIKSQIDNIPRLAPFFPNLYFRFSRENESQRLRRLGRVSYSSSSLAFIISITCIYVALSTYVDGLQSGSGSKYFQNLFWIFLSIVTLLRALWFGLQYRYLRYSKKKNL